MNYQFHSDGPLDYLWKGMGLEPLTVDQQDILMEKLEDTEECNAFMRRLITNHSVAFAKYVYGLLKLPLPAELLAD